ncbi:MAG: hypothetical protein KDK99_11305, partial [Verrucomicrobiales bacterium]|nr:hypothetical protein [Verrucomicrobiales bacterium]
MRLILLLLLAALRIGLTAAPETPAPKPSAPPVLSATITDRHLTDARQWRDLRSSLDAASAAGTQTVVFLIDTHSASPQQSLPLAEEIARLKLHTIAFVDPSAVAGGALFACACDEIWMTPGSRIGAAAPDLSHSGELSESSEKQLLIQALAVLKAGARGLCQIKHHRSDLAEAFIDAELEWKNGNQLLSRKGEVLLLDAEQATATAADGQPVFANGQATDLKDLARQTLKGQSIEPLSSQPSSTPTAAAPPVKPTRQGPYTGKVVRIPVGEEDLITPARFEFMSRTLERCTDEGAEAVIFDLDTPGGLAWNTTSLMMNDLQKLAPRSFAFVNPRALSAGAMIAVATDAIYFAPAGSSGASTPIYQGVEMGDAERAKMNSAIMSMARTVAKQKGHDPRVIEAMIDMDRELVVNGQVLCAKGEILTLDAEEATLLVDGKPLFAKDIATSLDDIKQAENLTGETITAEPVGFEQIAIWVTRYASILILIGIAGAYLEMQTPGFGLPGFVSLTAFGLFFFGHYAAGSLVGHEATTAIVVFFLGIILLIVEFFVLPGTLIFGILGFFCVMG